MGDAKKKSFKLVDKKHTPLPASDMVLFSNNFVSSKSVAGDAASSLYNSLSPPITILTL